MSCTQQPLSKTITKATDYHILATKLKSDYFPNHKQKWLSYLLDVIDIVMCPSCAQCDLFPAISLFIERVFKILFSTLLNMVCKNLRAACTSSFVS